MKAVVMAGGRGTRGRPYTDHFPKAMIPVNGVPLVERVVRHIGSHDAVDEVIIIADFGGLGAQIKNHMAAGCGTGGAPRFVQDSQSGTGGDLLCAAGPLEESGDRGFLLWFVDNLCALDIGGMKRRFDGGGRRACIATRSRRREETGFARMAADGTTVEEFVEKPVLDLPMPECLGIYMLDCSILKDIAGVRAGRKGGDGGVNLSFDILEDMSKRSQVAAYDIGDTEWMDVESPIVVDRNRALVDRITKRMES